MRTNLTVAGLVILLAACGHHPENGDHATHGEPASHSEPATHGEGHESHPAEHGSHDGELRLELDDGKKWPVDEHTRQSAARLSELVAGVETIASVEQARELAETLDQELDVLVKGCTMTGAAHDQLHVFLLAMIEQVTALREQEDLEALQGVREEIGSVLEAYGEHFE